MVVFNISRSCEVAGRVEAADTAPSRAKGLLGRDGLGPGEALWIVPCAMVHTFFMRFPIDVAFLDRELRVRRVVEDLRPWRLSPWVWSAHSVLEAAAGSLRGKVAEGDRIEIRS